MPKLSAGLLLYRVTDASVEVLIGHPGGRKDDGAWSIPKGEYAEGEDPWASRNASSTGSSASRPRMGRASTSRR